MAAYRSIVYREIVEIDGVEHVISIRDCTELINEKIDWGLIRHLESEVIDNLRRYD